MLFGTHRNETCIEPLDPYPYAGKTIQPCIIKQLFGWSIRSSLMVKIHSKSLFWTPKYIARYICYIK